MATHRLLTDMCPPHDDLQDLLLRELRAAVHARLADGADPAVVLADLDRRLDALREMKQAAAASRMK